MHDLVQATLNNGGLGVVYWEPAWVSTSAHTLWGIGSHWENAGFFTYEDNDLHKGADYLRDEYVKPVDN
ncbi:MAG: glycosyl hydrolase 53 family protein [Spirochaetaceae bacterium]|jgi:arabinogalactan endo-1,4-beta-galactosidase|nr:glycosyl hydrolase 53 family protein [Spirochaetaceae bacterium]